MEAEVTVRPIEENDYSEWHELYAGYANFYGVEQTAKMRDVVFSWFLDDGHSSGAFIARSQTDRLIGFAHYRPFARPLAASIGLYLDDLYVEPASRGSSAARLMLEEVSALAADKGWTIVRWITRDNNYRARSLYDKVATRTDWVTYDMHPALAGRSHLLE